MPRKMNVNVIKATDLLGFIKKEKPDFFGKLPEKRAAGIISAALVQLGKQLDAVKEGVVRVPGFGSFQVRQAELVKAGKKHAVRKVVFKSKPKK